MKYVLVFLMLSGCAAEMQMAKEDPIAVSGVAAVFIGAAMGLAQ